MKVIFLDIDGVLNTYEMYRNFIAGTPDRDMICNARLAILADIIQKTGAKIVISSAWRVLPETRKTVEDALEEFGIPHIGVTPKFYPKKLSMSLPQRCEEIRAWLDEHPEVVKFAIIDDDSHADVDGYSYFQTYQQDALTQEIADQVIAYLNS